MPLVLVFYDCQGCVIILDEVPKPQPAKGKKHHVTWILLSQAIQASQI